MTEEDIEHDHEEAVSEQSHDSPQESEQKMVPLSAMLATRKKLQDAEARAYKAEAASQLYQEHLMRAQGDKQSIEDQEDPNALVEKQLLHATTAQAKRDILETLYQDMNPEAVRNINTYLKLILEKKPWLASSVDSAPNRYARANEIVNDYKHLLEEEKPKIIKNQLTDGQRIVQNANKPRSPVDTAKSAQPKGAEYLKSIQGKKEFREYRKKLLSGES